MNSDDGVRVWINNELIIDKWIDQAGNYSDYFTSSGGYYPVSIDYKENGGSAGLNYEIVEHEPYNNFGDPDGIVNSWNATFYHWNGKGNPIFDDNHKIGTVNLGGNIRGDGTWGMNPQNWGTGSPAPEVPTDFFAMRAYTRVNLTAGHKYKVWLRSDDGYRMWAHKLGGNAFNITENALGGTFLSGAFGGKEFTFVAPESGTFDFHAQMFERGGDAYFDLSVTDLTAPPPPPSSTSSGSTGQVTSALLTQQGTDYFNTRSQYYITNNIFAQSGYGSSLVGNRGYTEGNCTWYVNGRLLELGASYDALRSMSGHANTWHYNLSNGSRIVSTPQPGDIAQWTVNGANHVAVVERVNSNGTITISESHYSTNWDGGGAGTLHHVRTIGVNSPTRYIRVPGV